VPYWIYWTIQTAIMLIKYMVVFLFTSPKYRYYHDPLNDVVENWRTKLNERMRFKGYLKKDGYLIRVSSNDAVAYQVVTSFRMFY